MLESSFFLLFVVSVLSASCTFCIPYLFITVFYVLASLGGQLSVVLVICWNWLNAILVSSAWSTLFQFCLAYVNLNCAILWLKVLYWILMLFSWFFWRLIVAGCAAWSERPLFVTSIFMGLCSSNLWDEPCKATSSHTYLQPITLVTPTDEWW